MAMAVRPIPATSASKAPSEANAAATCTSGSAHDWPNAAASGLSGPGDSAGAQAMQQNQRHDGVESHNDPEAQPDGPRYCPRRVSHFFAQGCDPCVSREGKKEQSRALQYPWQARIPASHGRRPVLGAAEDRDHHNRQECEHRHHDESCGCRRSGDPQVVDADEQCNGRSGRWLDPGFGHRIGGKGERHGSRRGSLAHHEPPACDESGPRAQHFPAVGVGSPGGGVACRQLGAGTGIRVGKCRSQEQGHQQGRPCRGSRRRECGKEPGADHGPEPDHDCVLCAQPSLQPGTHFFSTQFCIHNHYHREVNDQLILLLSCRFP